MYLSRVFSSARQRAVAPPGSAGGVVAQSACDLLFLLIWYMGAPASVRAQWGKLYGDVEDELHAMFTLPGGAEVGFDSSWSVPGYPHPATVIELEGENGRMLASDDALELDLFEPRAGGSAGHSRLGHAALPQLARFDLAGEALYLQDAAFLAWVTGAPAPPNHAGAAFQVVRVIEALYASAREGGRAVVVAA
jgi:predicted dehydrogenase